jgi:hypothetical protein
MLQAERSPVRVPDEVDFFNLPNTSSCTMALGSTQPLTKTSTRNLPGGKKWPAPSMTKCPKIWEPQPLATLLASTVCTGIFIFVLHMAKKCAFINAQGLLYSQEPVR